MAVYNPTPEELGRRRFPDNKSFRSTLSNASGEILRQIQSLLPSNYPEEYSTNLNIFNRVSARELARLNLSMSAINNDKDYTQTRAQYLNQILGERLLLGSRIAPAGYNDETYRNYLLAIRTADLQGSKKSVIEALASAFTGQIVNIKELYLKARSNNSSLSVANSANKMVVQVLIDDILQAGQNINVLKDNLDFFINLVRPAHVLYDTELIWTEQININKIYDLIFGDTGGGCVPLYDYVPFNETVILALQVFVLPGPEGATGVVDSIHHTDYIFYLDDSTKVITEPGYFGTKIYDITGKQVTLNGLELGSYVRINYQIIPGDFQFWRYPSEILTTPYAQFYRDVYRLPLFQEYVKKEMDSNGRFPLQIKTTPTTLCDRWVQDALQPLYEDLRSDCYVGEEIAGFTSEVLGKRKGFPKLSWPFPESTIYDQALLGSDYIQFMEHYPLTDGSSSPAVPVNISVILDGTALTGAIKSVDASTGRVYLNDSTAYWEPSFGRYPINGDEFTFSYHYLQDGTNYDATTETIFGISYWQINKVPILKGDSSGTLADKTDVKVYVDGTSIQNAIIDFDPLLGHITLSPYLNFWADSSLGRAPVIETSVDGTNYSGDTFKFVYTYGSFYDYGLFFDEPGRTMDIKGGVDSPYGMLMDGSTESMAIFSDTTTEIGYRYRTYLLQHSSVLNSPDTLNLNDFQKPANRASIANKQTTLNQFNKVFSAEFLYDPDPLPEILDDAYLDNGLDPVLKLNPGTPTFQQTFAYQPKLIYQDKLQDIRTNHKLLLYSDLLLKEFKDTNSEVRLSSICDRASVGFKVGLKESLDHIKECSPWIIFDTVTTEDVTLSIPGDYKSVPNLRLSNKLLRQNFILREVESTGTAQFSYSFTTPSNALPSTTFNLPATYKMFLDDDWVDFPTLPIVDIDGNPATIANITCTVNGEAHGIISLNPTTGQVVIDPYSTIDTIGEIITLTAEQASSAQIMLPDYVTDPFNLALNVVNGTSQSAIKDFRIIDRRVTWYFSDLKNLLQAGDQIRLTYSAYPVSMDVEFTYHVLNNAIVKMIDRNRSRIMDNGYVFGGICYDVEGVEIGVRMNEYYSFLDDDSDGIKLSFFNKDTLALEEHIFSGPVFESFIASEDEIGVPANFPNALVRIPNPLSLNNPLNFSADYGFLNDSLVRFRKKTYQELLPDRSFRILKLTEMLPV